jgi:hypothetical protein
MAGNSTIGALKVSLGLDSAQFETGLKRSQAGLSGFAKAAGAAGAIAATALIAAGTAFAVAVKGAIDTADEMGKAAQKVGLTVEGLSRLNYAASLSDVSLDQLSTGLKRLSAGMVDAATTGKGPAAEAFRTLGLSVTDASGKLKAGDAVFGELAGKFAGMQDGAGKTALAIDIFGKSGADLIPLLNSGAEGLAAMNAEADALGITISTSTAKQAEIFNDNLTRLKAAGTGVTQQIASGLLPGLSALSGTLVSGAKNAQFMGVITGGLNIALKSLATVGVVVGAALANVGRSLAAMGQIGQQILTGNFKGAFDTYRTTVTANAKEIVDSLGRIKAVWTATGADLKAAAPQLGAGIAAPLAAATPAIKAAGAEAVKEARYWVEEIKAAVSPEAFRVDFAGLGPTAVPTLDTSRLSAMIMTLESAREAADAVSWSVDDIFYGLKNNNWGLAAGGIARALQSVQKAFSATGTAADKFSAIAGIGQAVGAQIGGKTGGAISGAASGAMAGFTVGGPVGAAIGGALGFIGGIFGSSKAKKAEKAAAAKAAAEEAAAKAAAEAARLQAIANERRALEIQIMRATGNELGALNAEREDALAASDDSNDELLKQLWALTDASDAAAKALGIASDRRLLEIELMRATGNEAGALAAERAAELEGLDASLRALKQQVFAAEDFAASQASAAEAVSAARDQLSAAYEREADALRSTIERFSQFRDSLAAFRQSLNEGSGAGGGYEAVSAAFRNTASLARLGNEQALGDLQGVSERFLAVSRAGAKTQLDYLRDLGAVKAAVSAAELTAGRQVSVAERQLGELTNTVSGLLAVDTSVKGVSASIEALNIALLAQITDQNARIEAAASVASAAAGEATSLAQQVADLTATVAAGQQAIALATNTTAKVLTGWDFDGQPEVRDVA